MENFDACAFLLARWKNLALWRNLWTILLFVVGAACTVFFVAAIMWFITADWIAAAVSTVGTITHGMAIGWILARRNDAVAEEEKAKKELLEHCGSKQPPQFLARESTSPPTDDVAKIVEETEKRLMLLNLFR